MKKLLKLLLHRSAGDHLPYLPRSYSTEYQLGDQDDHVITLIELSQTRSPQGVEMLRARHKAKHPRELIHLLPYRRRKRKPWARLMNSLRRGLGVTSYDPAKGARRAESRQRGRQNRR